MVAPLLQSTTRSAEHITSHSVNDRLIQLIVKGTLYEGCVDYCQAQAINDQKGFRLPCIFMRCNILQILLSLYLLLLSLSPLLFGHS